MKSVTFLKSNDHCRIATISKDGYPHCVPVGYFYHNDIIYIPTNSKSNKVRNLTHNPKCCVIVDTYANRKGRGILVQGKARVAFGKHYCKLKSKIEKLTGWKLDNWRLGDPPKDKVDTIIQIDTREKTIIRIGDLC